MFPLKYIFARIKTYPLSMAWTAIMPLAMGLLTVVVCSERTYQRPNVLFLLIDSLRSPGICGLLEINQRLSRLPGEGWCGIHFMHCTGTEYETIGTVSADGPLPILSAQLDHD